MICMNFRTVLYCAGRRRLITLYTSRTVAGPMLHSTVRISSSALVGRGGSCGIYEDITSNTFVCQVGFFAEVERRSRVQVSTLFVSLCFSLDRPRRPHSQRR